MIPATSSYCCIVENTLNKRHRKTIRKLHITHKEW